MDIEARSLAAAGRALRDRINRLLTTTITLKPLIAIMHPHAPTELQFGFRDEGVLGTAPLATAYGAMSLRIIQNYKATPGAARRVGLRMAAYQYTLTPAAATEPIIRWEYVADPPDDARWCRHHVQGPIPVNLGRATVPLNDLHLPTGPVPLAEVIRFCIVDLGVEPLSDDWQSHLHAAMAPA